MDIAGRRNSVKPTVRDVSSGGYGCLTRSETSSDKLTATGYFIDPVLAHVVFLAAKLQKPLLLEGPAGSGKTQLAVSVAAAANTRMVNSVPPSNAAYKDLKN